MQIQLDQLTLSGGSHKSRHEGVCATEAIAWLAGEPHSDHPACMSRSIGALMRSWNDALPSNEERDRLLKPLLPLCIGTAGAKALEKRRAFMAMDWLIREFTPTWLDACNGRYAQHTAALRAIPEITNWQGLIDATPILVAASKEVDAAWAAARAAAWAAAWAAAGDALKPTVSRLQESAAELVRKMCAAKDETNE